MAESADEKGFEQISNKWQAVAFGIQRIGIIAAIVGLFALFMWGVYELYALQISERSVQDAAVKEIFFKVLEHCHQPLNLDQNILNSIPSDILRPAQGDDHTQP